MAYSNLALLLDCWWHQSDCRTEYNVFMLTVAEQSEINTDRIGECLNLG